MLDVAFDAVLDWQASRCDWRSTYGASILGIPDVYSGVPGVITPAGALLCRKCGTIDTPIKGPGSASGVHTARALCRHCGGFICWLSTKTPAEDSARRARARWYAKPSERQLAYLKILGYAGPTPTSSAQASDLIEQQKTLKGWS